MVKDNPEYLDSQILTYLGNKRKIVRKIEGQIVQIKDELQKPNLVTLDLFSGTGIVARMLKRHSNLIYVNDLEAYSAVINDCYLTNSRDFDEKIYNHYLSLILKKIEKEPVEGFVSRLYAPKDTQNIQLGERCFYTHEGAVFIDSFRKYIDDIVPEEYKKFFLARLLIEACSHANSAGVFKGFYKDKNTGIGKFGGTDANSLCRMFSSFDMSAPVLSDFSCEYKIFQEDANELVKRLKGIDVAYLDPPYNQHPYGSNYFMLNAILENKEPENISEVAGIPKEWNHSQYNRKNEALTSLSDLIDNLDAKYVIISYNNEGFIKEDEMEEMLRSKGEVSTTKFIYSAYKASRNFKERNKNTYEYLFVLKKDI